MANEKETGDLEGQTFSADYVKKLREENAGWRNKVRELESHGDIYKELNARGIKAEASWVRMKEGQSVKEAVEQFATDYPHLTNTITQVDNKGTGKPDGKPTPKPDKNFLKTGSTNNPSPAPQGALGDRDLSEIKKDPVARSQLREQYREMLRSSSYQKSEV